MTLPRSLLLLIPLLAVGCQNADRPPANVDLSTPRSTAIVYLKAIQRGDAATAKSVSVGTRDQKNWVEALATLVDGMRSYDNALYAKFGRYSHQVHTDLGNSLMMLADGPIDWIGSGSISSDEHKARIDPKRKGFASKFQPSVYLLLGKYGWMVDVEQTYAEGATAEQLRALSQSFSIYQDLGKAMKAASRDVLAGRFHSVDESSQALAERLKAIKSDDSSR